MSINPSARIRQALFQAHLWVALVLSLALVVLSVTGSVLMFPAAVNRLNGPAPQVDVADAAALAPGAYLEAARAALPPGARVQSVRLPAEPGDAVAVGASTGRAGPGGGRTVWLDPATGALIKVGPTTSPIFALAHDLHGSFLVPGVGRSLVGWAGVALLILSLSGLWLWWPRGAFLKGFHWRRTPDTLMNLHYTAGFWISLPLAVVSATGILISFPQFAATVLGTAPPAPRLQAAPNSAPGPRGPAAPAAPTQSVEAVVAAAQAAQPSGRLLSVTLPGAARPGPAAAAPPAWRVDFDEAGKTRSVRIDDATGAVAAAPPPEAPRAPTPQRLMRELHEGQGAGPVWLWIVFLTGVLPVLFAVTGVWYWAKLELRKARARRAQAA